MTDGTIELAPVAGKARIEVLDMLRGLAILGIFYMNVPYMGAALWPLFDDIRSLGWTPVDRATWIFVQVYLEGTQRGLLELLFGAGLMVMAAKAMTPDGPVAVADLYIRRNLWLLLFGLFDVFVLMWSGDVLHIYALAALFLFPFRKLAAKWLLVLGMAWSLAVAIGATDRGVLEYVERTALVEKVEAAKAKQAAQQPLAKAEAEALKEWEKLKSPMPKAEYDKLVAQERAAHAEGSVWAYAQLNWGFWFMIQGKGALLPNVVEAFCTMLIGIALWKWGVIQGLRSKAFYLWLILGCYGFGLVARGYGATELMSFEPIPKTLWLTYEGARVAVTVGHVALVNWAVRTGPGRAILAPFKAAGRTAFSLYFMQQIIGLFILFAPWGFNLWARFGWAELAGIATAVIAVQLVIANLWVRWFAAGPFEWLWRSLAYLRWQPFLRRDGQIAASNPARAP